MRICCMLDGESIMENVCRGEVCQKFGDCPHSGECGAKGDNYEANDDDWIKINGHNHSHDRKTEKTLNYFDSLRIRNRKLHNS